MGGGTEALEAPPTTTRRGDSMPVLPAQTIRAFLDHNGGETDATVDNLLVTFAVPKDPRTGRQRIATELSHLGVEIDRPLGSLAPQDTVHLSLAGVVETPEVDVDAELGRFATQGTDENGHAAGDRNGTNGHGNGSYAAQKAQTEPPP